MQLDLGSHVKTSDGRDVGKVSRIIFEPDTMKVREFVVREGVLFTHDRIVARALVDHIDEDHVVHLRLTAGEAEDLPPFISGERTPIFSGDQHHANEPLILTTPGSVPRDAVVLSHGSEVYDRSGKHIGHLDEIIYGPDGVAAAFIVDTGFLVVHDVTVTASALGMVRHDRIELTIEVEQAEAVGKV